MILGESWMATAIDRMAIAVSCFEVSAVNSYKSSMLIQRHNFLNFLYASSFPNQPTPPNALLPGNLSKIKMLH